MARLRGPFRKPVVVSAAVMAYESQPVRPTQSFEPHRACGVCRVPLCSYNPGHKCWLHGGWEDHELAEFTRALLKVCEAG